MDKVAPWVYPKLCLASQSPRRQELLQQIGVSFNVQPADIDESVLIHESPNAYVKRISEAKALAVFNKHNLTIPVLAADTAVVKSGHILGKPESRSDAERMLNLLSGSSHQVITGVAVIDSQQSMYLESVSTVYFNPLSNMAIKQYIKTQEGFDKAGGYAVQGLAASFIHRIDGSYSGIMGLPLEQVSQLMLQFKIACWLNNNG